MLFLFLLTWKKRNEDAPSTVAVATASPPASPLPLAADITNFLLNHCELASTLLTCYTRAEESEKLHVFISYLHVFVHNRVEQRLIEHHIQREASLCCRLFTILSSPFPKLRIVTFFSYIFFRIQSIQPLCSEKTVLLPSWFHSSSASKESVTSAKLSLLY